MDSFLENVKNWTKSKTEQLTQQLHNMTERKSITIEDLATILLLHPETQIKTKQYLNIMYHECTLVLDGFEYYLETRGENHDHILEITVKENGEIMSSFHSYRDKKRKITVPEQITTLKSLHH